MRNEGFWEGSGRAMNSMQWEAVLRWLASDPSARNTLSILSEPTAIRLAVLTWVALGAAAYGVARWRRWNRARILSAILCAGTLAVVLWVTLLARLPDDWERPASNQPCNFALESFPTDFEALLNWLLFLPFALSFVLATRRPLLACLATLALSCAIELVQSIFLLGGCQLSDLVSNVTGGIIGAAAGAAITAFRKRRLSSA